MEMLETTLPFPTTQKPAKVDRFRGRQGSRLIRAHQANSRLPDALYNDIDSDKIFVTELPIHREMVSMATQGYKNSEIAAATGYHPTHVSRVLRQPHSRQYMIEHAKKDVSQEIKNFLEGEVLENLRVMKTIRDDPNVKAETRLLAADKLTDRQLGRPNQPFSLPSGGKPVSQMSLAEIDEALRQQGVVATAGTPVGSETPQDNSSVAA